MLKAHDENKFRFLLRKAKIGDSYFNSEWRFQKKFPYIKRKIIKYTLVAVIHGEYWLEDPDQ